METFEKLDFLMSVTNTKNTTLSKALSFDPSYISRIRSGARSVPKNPAFFEMIASYFARNVRDGYQLETISRTLTGKEAPITDKKEFEASLLKWLKGSDSNTIPAEPVAKLLTDMNAILGKTASQPSLPADFKNNSANHSHNALNGSAVSINVFYGNSGKRESVKLFLQSLVEQNKSFKLYLFSDEEMSWLYESPEFAREWAILLMKLLTSGSKIKIIHTISRDLIEMMEAIRKWIPLYVTGGIEPYYYPRMRDGSHRRSLFIASGFAAVTSNSIENNTENMANFLTYDRNVVGALEAEYSNYLSLCRPLMKIYSQANSHDFMQNMTDAEGVGGNYYLAQPSPALWTMPYKTARSICKDESPEQLISRINQSHDNLINILERGGSVTELLSLPSEDQLAKTDIFLPHSDMIGYGKLKYTKADLFHHLQSTCDLQNKYANFNVAITDKVPSTIIVLSHQESDSVLSNASSPTVAFTISQQQLSSAFYEYLDRTYNNCIKDDSVSLERYIYKLKRIENID